ncbi:uncharacterized protein G2W53_041225 [Senna tora]|uniref:Uncharacterized protein n=1 Tax=Senna tora TaxID=362788 RepID=A0A834W2P8_9FABA|nr:uncharacterized protein G2W53_041225 [Senna tora]
MVTPIQASNPLGFANITRIDESHSHGNQTFDLYFVYVF